MNQLEMLTIFVDSAAQLPETKHLKRALKQANKRIEVLRTRYARFKVMREARLAREAEEDRELAAIAQANPERFIAGGRCPVCGFWLENCRCEKDNK